VLDGSATSVRYLRQPFQREADFGVTSVNYDLVEVLRGRSACVKSKKHVARG